MLLIECYRPTEIALEKVPDLLNRQRRATQLIIQMSRSTTNHPSAEKGLNEEDEINDFFNNRVTARSAKNGGLTLTQSADIAAFDGI